MKKINVLFIVENDFFPRDTRVYNECKSVSKLPGYNCFVLAPKLKEEKWIELFDDKIKCFRFPHFDASNTLQLFIEYTNAFIWILLYSIILIFRYNINIIHVANPPDFIIPSLFFFKLIGVKFIYDIHDFSLDIIKDKEIKNRIIFHFIYIITKYIFKLSIFQSDLLIVVNNSMINYVNNINKNKEISIIRNSNNKIFNSLDEINKKENRQLTLVYIGIINSDYSLGIDNLINIADYLEKKKIKCQINVIGYGNYIDEFNFKIKIKEFNHKIENFGYLDLQKAYNVIKNSDFGIVTLNRTKRSEKASSMKTIDYMCCGVPVCSLNLKEQLYTTGGIGIHTNTFEEMGCQIIEIYNDRERYEKIREDTLRRFNEYLCWEIQEKELQKAYKRLLCI